MGFSYFSEEKKKSEEQELQIGQMESDGMVQEEEKE